MFEKKISKKSFILSAILFCLIIFSFIISSKTRAQSLLSVCCSVTPLSVEIGNPVSWKGTVYNGTPNFKYEWSGTDSLSGTVNNSSNREESLSKSYDTVGVKSGVITITDSNGNGDTVISNNTCAVTVCQPKNFSGNVSSATVAPGGNYRITCDYGTSSTSEVAVSGYSGTCGSAQAGASEVFFDCTAGSGDAGRTFSPSCELIAKVTPPTNYFCPRTDTMPNSLTVINAITAANCTGSPISGTNIIRWTAGSVTGGAPPYSYAWGSSANPPIGIGGDANGTGSPIDPVNIYSDTEQKIANLKVTDSGGNIFVCDGGGSGCCSAQLPCVTKDFQPPALITPNPVNVGQSYTVQCDFGTTSGVTTNAPGCPANPSYYVGTTATFECASPSAGNFNNLECRLNSGLPGNFCANSAPISTLTVNSNPINISCSEIVSHLTVAWTGLASSGTPPYTYTWGGDAINTATTCSTCGAGGGSACQGCATISTPYTDFGTTNGTIKNATVNATDNEDRISDTITCPATLNCNSTSSFSGSIDKSTVALGEKFNIYCNYGAYTNAIIAYSEVVAANNSRELGRCTFKNFEPDNNTAVFECTANVPGTSLRNYCGLDYIPTDYFCPKEDQLTQNIKVTVSETAKCGGADGQTFPSAPTTNLCSVGDPTTVVGPTEGPWEWMCINGESIDWCRALSENNSDTPLCGSSHLKSFASAPTTGLCSVGTPTLVNGPTEGPWSWECIGAPNKPPAPCQAFSENDPNAPACNPLTNGKFLATKPTTNLCLVGDPTLVEGPTEGPWAWMCINTSGARIGCNAFSLNDPNAPACNPLTNGKFFAIKPTTDLCGTGSTPSFVEGPNEGPWRWNCIGPTGAIVGCNAFSLNDPNAPACGPAHSQILTLAPTTNLCLSGTSTPTPVLGSGPWSWACVGLSGASVNCIAYCDPSVPTCDCPGTGCEPTNAPFAHTLNAIEYPCKTPSVNFSWYYSNSLISYKENKYQLQVSKTSFSNPDPEIVVDITVSDLNNLPGTPNSQSINLESGCSEDDCLNYGQEYYWRVKVSNNGSEWSDWFVGTTSFTTAEHAWPYVNFTPPSVAYINRSASFTDTSMCYRDENDVTGYPCTCYDEYNSRECTDNGSVTYEWWFDFPAAADPLYTSFGSNTFTETYTSVGAKQIKVEVCDDVGCCSATDSIIVRKPSNVPDWMEISPFK